ncbi:hypothetical protein Patl1_20555 [Pistacia atlantica]|uniref:Uncharacterized protein n=1 Tax=Pistacia atlantica TaxID=434234 RepID=A0ACC1BKU1_9ROSI|nr:hypothetical protein Patl1_20555 [Pistacia atlantica]
MQLGFFLGLIPSVTIIFGLPYASRLFTTEVSVLQLIGVTIPFIAVTQPINALAFIFDGIKLWSIRLCIFCLLNGCGGNNQHPVLVHTILNSWLFWHLDCFIHLYEFAYFYWIFEGRNWNRTLELSQGLIAAWN